MAKYFTYNAHPSAVMKIKTSDKTMTWLRMIELGFRKKV